MKKRIIYFCILNIFFLPVKVYATDYRQEMEKLSEEYNVNPKEIMDITPSDIISSVKNYLSDYRSQPLQLTGTAVAYILICRIIKAFSSDKNKATDTVTDSLCILVIFICLLGPAQNIITEIIQTLSQVKNFMVMFLPLFSSIMAASGEIMTSAVSSGFFLTGIIFISDFCVDIIIPSIQLYFALIISNCLSPYIRLKSISDLYIKSVRWVMRSIVSVICFVLTVQTTLTSGKENLAVKTGKILAGNSIPVIGSVLQDAVSSVYAGMEVIKGFSGMVGIFTIISIFLPSTVIVVLYNLCFNILFILCDIFDLKQIGECVKGFINITELIISIIFLFAVLMIFSLTIMINLTRG